jgi:MFS family permease
MIRGDAGGDHSPARDRTASWRRLPRPRTASRSRSPGGSAVARIVVYLGLTSFFTDVSAEMVTAVLPVYLVLYLQLSPLAFGAVDGVYQGATVLVRLIAGAVADRWQRHRDVAAAGYALSALSKLGLLAAGAGWAPIALATAADRIGKGIRTAPRDAMIANSSPTARLGAAFGVHRAFDTAGAMLGPIVAFGILALAPGAFDAVFVSSFAAALIGLGVICLLVDNRTNAPRGGRVGRASACATHHRCPGCVRSGLLHGQLDGPVSFSTGLGLLRGAGFRVVVAAGAALGLATVSDGFVYLILQRRGELRPELVPLMYVGTALVYMVLAVPVGRLSDRIGRPRVFLAGYGLLLAVYLGLLLAAPGGTAMPLAAACLIALGAYYAATDGVLAALASALVPADVRATGLALLATSTSAARMGASLLFGALWAWAGVETAIGAFAAAMAGALLVAAVLLGRPPAPPGPPAT